MSIPSIPAPGRRLAKRLSRASRKTQRLFLRYDPDAPRHPAAFTRAAVGVTWLARFFYLFAAHEIGTTLRFSYAYRGEPTDPLWPISVLTSAFGPEWLAQTQIIAAAGLIVGLLAAIFPGSLLWRLGVFLYLFLHAALWNSYGAINHSVHFYIFIAFALLFLPPTVGVPKRMSRKDVLNCLMVFWFAQTLILLSYSLAGLWKIVESQITLIAPTGFVRIMLSRIMDDVQPDVPLLMPYLAPYEYPAQILFLSLVYIQLFALLALFRPHLHRPLGIALILFHLGTGWLLNVWFREHVVFLGLFLVFSPMAPDRFSLWAALQSLPILGIPFRLWAARPPAAHGAAWLVYDGECPLCRNYARYLDIRNAVGDFTLINARDGGPQVDEIRAIPYNLNHGMVLKLNGRYYFGSDALHILARLSSKRGAFNLTNRLLFSTPGAAWAAYPLLKQGRRLLLKLKRVPQLPP